MPPLANYFVFGGLARTRMTDEVRRRDKTRDARARSGTKAKAGLDTRVIARKAADALNRH